MRKILTIGIFLCLGITTIGMMPTSAADSTKPPEVNLAVSPLWHLIMNPPAEIFATRYWDYANQGNYVEVSVQQLVKIWTIQNDFDDNYNYYGVGVQVNQKGVVLYEANGKVTNGGHGIVVNTLREDNVFTYCWRDKFSPGSPYPDYYNPWNEVDNSVFIPDPLAPHTASGTLFTYGGDAMDDECLSLLMVTVKVPQLSPLMIEVQTTGTFDYTNFDEYPDNPPIAGGSHTYTVSASVPSAVPFWVASANYNSIQLAWGQSGSSDFYRYELHRATFSTFTPSASTLVYQCFNSPTTVSFTDTLGISTSSLYYYKLRVYTNSERYTQMAVSITTPANPAQTTLTITVLSFPQGVYLSGATVSCSGKTTQTTGTDGTVKFTGISKGSTVTVTAMKATYQTNYITVTMDANKARTIYLSKIGAPKPTGGGSSCPYIQTWNGTDYELDNSMLSASEIPYMPYNQIVDNYRLQKSSIPVDGVYRFQIKEVEKYETTYLDQLELITVDHDDSFMVGVSPYGEILTYQTPEAPISCVDFNGNDVMPELQNIDDTYFDGYANDSIIATFPNQPSLPAKLILRADIKCPSASVNAWGDTDLYGPITISVLDDDNSWVVAGSIIPRELWATEILDITGYLPQSTDTLTIRLNWFSHHKLDCVALDRSEPGNIDVQTYALSSAVHSTYGDVISNLTYGDETYTPVLPGEYINFEFPYVAPTAQFRDIIMKAKGYYCVNEDYTNIQDIDIFQNVNVTLRVSGSEGNTVKMYIVDDIDDVSRQLNATWITCYSTSSNAQTVNIRGVLNHNTRVILAYENQGVGTNVVEIVLETDGMTMHYEVLFDSANGIQQESTILVNEALEQFYNNGSRMYYAPYIPVNGVIEPVAFLWDFGIGQIQNNTDTAPRELPFNEPGQYTVKLTVQYVNEKNATFLWNITLPNRKPHASILTYQTVQITLLVAGRKDNTVTLTIFEDGVLINSTSVTRQPGDPKAQAKTINLHKYLGHTYVIQLSYDASNSGENPITIYFKSGTFTSEYSTTFCTNNGYHQEMIVQSSYLDSIVEHNMLFYFDARASYDFDGAIISYKWNFGDDNIAVGSQVSHLFTAAGTYTVNLWVTDNDGDINNTSIIITIPA